MATTSQLSPARTEVANASGACKSPSVRGLDVQTHRCTQKTTTSKSPSLDAILTGQFLGCEENATRQANCARGHVAAWTNNNCNSSSGGGAIQSMLHFLRNGWNMAGLGKLTGAQQDKCTLQGFDVPKAWRYDGQSQSSVLLVLLGREVRAMISHIYDLCLCVPTRNWMELCKGTVHSWQDRAQTWAVPGLRGLASGFFVFSICASWQDV